MVDVDIPTFKAVDSPETGNKKSKTDTSILNKRVLIIEDLGEMRLMLKSLMSSLGYQKIDIEPSGQSAIKRVLEIKYDIVLSDFNLGGSVDGQQILETTRKTYSLDHSTIFIMITADTAYEAVVSVLEYQPDSYLVKPFPPQSFIRRLGKVRQQKKIFEPLNKARIDQDFEKVIELARAIKEKFPQYTHLCLKSIGEALFAQERYKEAKTHYLMVIKEHKNLAWAHYGIAECELKLGAVVAAIKNLEQTITLSRHFLSAYDTLADAHEKMENYEQAQSILKSVLEVSPRSIERSKRLAELSVKNRDWPMAEHAFSRAIRLSRDSNEETYDLYYGHLQSITQMIEQGSDVKKLNDKFKRSLTRLRIIGKQNPTAVSNSFRIEVQQYVTRNHMAEAIKSWKIWRKLIEDGLATPLSEAQEYTLKKRLNL
ncbi:response regulator [Marinomonas balearica]|uniref:CheY-like chemotaxis protein n=1 Tax=Marinomonas balearica TaxID=491947 RepID=A0A4R6MB40_9GAMM|nr:response regulator [Marinomonas balearica]TDO98693.1 CheY-like chemotaxis protein [Marinomonas balearica]